MIRYKLTGGRDLAAALRQLPERARRPTLLRALKVAAAPIAEDAAERVGVWTGRLAENIAVLAVPKRSSESEAAVRIGPTTEAFEGLLQEFGTARHAPVPALRPAWDAGAPAALDRFASELRTQIERAAARVAKKAAKP